ncbi:helix-turn-helix domain-containing protein [Acinetobacter pittii]|uniref:helix-turn-helix domain-containing protein n=1 Tax=Acinetobacter pittii TaxID=48296 RepID=UPI00194E3C27|nr:helix-turn-helix domain-containing protein [Acinetobacter pittii]QRQ11544.1 helix-turn-helix domain-containing protein [Acinetobacter pittii]
MGRPEVLTHEQQLKVIELFQKGSSVYSIARKFSVVRTVIKRVLEKAKDFS